MAETIQTSGYCDEPFILGDCSFTKEGYSLANWNTQADGTGQSYEVGSQVFIGQNTQLFAQWRPVSYGITYNLDGGSVSSANPTSYTIETETFTLNNPTQTNYYFNGWTGSDLASAQKTVTIPTGSMGDREYTATWLRGVYTSSTKGTYTLETDGIKNVYVNLFTSIPKGTYKMQITGLKVSHGGNTKSHNTYFNIELVDSSDNSKDKPAAISSVTGTGGSVSKIALRGWWSGTAQDTYGVEVTNLGKDEYATISATINSVALPYTQTHIKFYANNPNDECVYGFKYDFSGSTIKLTRL